MREILFKAKHKNWRELPKEEWWVEGSYHHQTDYYGDLCDTHYIINGNATDTEGYGEHYEIDPETLCQYTGLKDKNGNRIWENDIVSGYFNHKKITGFIKYGSNAVYYIEREGSYGIHLDNSEDWLEVIGNIFDNPELLKGE